MEEPLPELSLVEIYARRAHKLQQRQAAIAAMSCAVVENPEENVSCSLHSICMLSIMTMTALRAIVFHKP